ncbi:hypothetical protein F5144DRAFT_10265 [Chaetomium tenue]|uniref:Uncharacterized protein n=1 Tax=Chaetomium tenue TaxID=1854479 RepID=A0ACB7PMQ5_9PEZI|nr:hypothetical protein F5144DRAFT_10265 [Chaetomium globosum]
MTAWSTSSLFSSVPALAGFFALPAAAPPLPPCLDIGCSRGSILCRGVVLKDRAGYYSWFQLQIFEYLFWTIEPAVTYESKAAQFVFQKFNGGGAGLVCGCKAEGQGAKHGRQRPMVMPRQG